MTHVLTTFKNVFLIGVVLMAFSCTEEETKSSKPELSTTAVTNIGRIGATSGGTIVSQGSSSITARGICWSTVTQPTIDNDKSIDGEGTGEFESTLVDLLPNTTYFVRAYATNKVGTAYGDELSFATNEFGLPTLSNTGNLENVGLISAHYGVSVIDNGGSPITKLGVCYSKTPNPTIEDSKKEFNNTEGVSGLLFNNLDPSTKYYARSYAINSTGIAYANEISFTTKSKMVDGDGNEYDVVKINGLVWMKENLRTKKYANGVDIPTTTSNLSGAVEPKYYWAYNNDNNNNINYGLLYTWYVANDGNHVCPNGTKVPNYEELSSLGASGAYALRETGLTTWSNNLGTNTTGFGAEGAGIRFNDATFGQLNDYWLPQTLSSDPGNMTQVKTKAISVHYNDTFTDITQSKNYGLPIRCVAVY